MNGIRAGQPLTPCGPTRARVAGNDRSSDEVTYKRNREFHQSRPLTPAMTEKRAGSLTEIRQSSMSIRYNDARLVSICSMESSLDPPLQDLMMPFPRARRSTTSTLRLTYKYYDRRRVQLEIEQSRKSFMISSKAKALGAAENVLKILEPPVMICSEVNDLSAMCKRLEDDFLRGT
ncbi:hypothetical protein J6590_010236 [Homalodisca vitripennis]|nr:hypothetical protein J6590_010236 [Homalodisca vitripennis]